MHRHALALILVASACGRLGFDARSDGAGVGADGVQVRDARSDALQPVTAGELAAYSFSEGVGDVSADISGNGNGISEFTGAPTWTAAGHTGSALTFTTINDGYSTPSPSANLAVTSAFTLMGWVYPTLDPAIGESLVVSYYINSPESFPYGLESFDYNGYTGEPNCYYQASTNSYVGIGASAKLTLDTWTHLACTFDGTTLAIYVDGSLDVAQSEPGSVDTTGTQVSLVIGCDNANDHANLGSEDDVRVYGRALTAAEIVDAMNTPVAP